MGSQDFHQTQKTASKRSSNFDDEETDSVLGYSNHRSNDAVSIAKPGHRGNPYKHPGSVKPINTLTTTPNLPSQTFSARVPASKSRYQGLSVQVSRGYNVTNHQAIEVGDSFEKPPSAKRQKMNHSDSKSTGESSDSTINDLPPDQIIFVGKSDKDRSSPHFQSSRVRKGPQQSMEMLDEYRSVEGMMDSNPRNAERNRAAAPQKTTSPLMTSMSRNNSVEVLGEAEHLGLSNARTAERRYQGTIRQHPETAQTNGVERNDHTLRGHETSSHYFSQKLPDQPLENERSLRHSFRASDGRRRGIDRLSSDELDGPATLGTHADVVPLSPRKCRHLPDPSSPGSNARPAKSPTRETALECSNIKSTVFQTQRPSKAKSGRRETFEEEYLDEGRPSWARPVAAINIPGQMEMHTSSGMAIVHDEDRSYYFVKDNGRALQTPNGSIYGLHPNKLQRCWTETSGKKIRFQSSKSGIHDNVLDLQLKSEKDANELLLRIQNRSTNVKVINENSEKMERLFEMRRRQPKVAPLPVSGFEDMPEDVQMYARNRHRQEIKDNKDQEVSNGARRGSRILDSLTNNPTGESASARTLGRKASVEKSNSSSTRTTGKENINTQGRSNLFDKVRPSHNDHLLRRSTRTSGGPRTFLGEPSEPEPPKFERYSIKYGLGDKWSRPISFPKMGKKKATVEWDDLERLDEGEFLNDNLVSFYMRYLEEELTNQDRDLAKTVYFFNSFFYDRLTTNQRGQKGINYEGVQRWTRGVDLFAYDFVIVPINEHSHWYVAIICNLPALDERMSSAEKSSPPAETANKQVNDEIQETILNEYEQQPEEKEARQSFAELSLEGKPEKRQASEDSLMGSLDQTKPEEKAAPKDDEDEEMLDRPIAVEQQNPHTESAKEVDDPNLEFDGVRKSPTMTKKQKRKSMPPSITKFDPSGPSIITFDSFGNPHSQVIRTLKQYLYEEGKAKRNTELDVTSIKGITAKNIPQQSNFSDCGLFMLGYVEKFLKDRPRNFIAKIIKREYDDKKDWLKMVPSTMRSDLRDQLQRLHAENMDERRAAAVKAGKLEPGLSGQKDAPPAAKEGVRRNGKAASAEPVKSEDGGLPANPRVDSHVDNQRPPNIEDVPTAIFHESQAEPSSELPTDAMNDTCPDASLIVIESHQSHPDVATKEELPDIASSQLLPQPPTTPGHDMVGSFSMLPNEIQDSQPSHQPPVVNIDRAPPPPLPARPTSPQPDKSPEDLALSPDPSSARQDLPSPSADDQQQHHQQPLPDQLYSRKPHRATASVDEKHSPAIENLHSPILNLPKRRGGGGRKGIATHKKATTTPSSPSSSTMMQQQQRGNSNVNGTKKMTKEEAIVLDD